MVDSFDHLANAIQKSALFCGDLLFLIAAWQGHQPDAVVGEEFGCFFSSDVSLIAHNAQSQYVREAFQNSLPGH